MPAVLADPIRIDSDESVQEGFVKGKAIQYPRIPGHEIIGDVVAVSPTEKMWRLGQRVGGGWHGGQCGICDRCRLNDYITCRNEDLNGAVSKSPALGVVSILTQSCV